MLALLAAAQFAIAQLSTPVPTHPAAAPTYSSPAVRDLVTRAAAANRQPPPSLRGYRARVESEFALVSHDTLGRELSSQVEQLDADASWMRDGEYDLHVEGYRTQSLGAPFSMLSVVRAWTVPTLYGDRLSLGADPVRAAGGRPDTMVAVHPLAADRDRFYRFSGGDTVTVLHTPTRAIPVVRIIVQPMPEDSTRLVLFDGELYLDATRGAIVRMRGRMVVEGTPHGGRPLWARLSGVVGVAFVEFVNEEVDGRYWLPAFQRTELEANVPVLGAGRAVFRLLSHFRDYAVDDSGAAVAAGEGGSPERLVRRVTWAPSDSLDSYRGWARQLGVATASVNAADFNDLAPDAWRGAGPPRLDLVPRRPSDIVRYNRVEGLYTGVATTLRFRSLAPGLTAQAFGGWAWTERTPRGGAGLALSRPPWITGVRAERMLASTNDFGGESAAGNPDLSAAFGSVDNADYVDRRRALLSATRVFGSADRALVTLQLGAGDDRSERTRLVHGAFGGGAPFRPNRNSLDGGYGLVTADATLHPDVGPGSVKAGVGASLHYEAASGGLAWQRAVLSLATRQYWGPITLTASAAGGVVAARILPPQQLFELGGMGTVSGYSYKQFAGDRAMLFGSFASYGFPIWRTPHRVWRAYSIPGLAPGIAIGAEGGWAGISSAAARTAVDALGAGWSATPVSQATGGVRASVGIGLTFFSDAFHVGLARPVDHAAPWRAVAGFGRAF